MLSTRIWGSSQEVTERLPDPPDPDQAENPEQVADAEEEEVVDWEGDGRRGSPLGGEVAERRHVDRYPNHQLEQGGDVLDRSRLTERYAGERPQEEQEGEEDPQA